MVTWVVTVLMPPKAYLNIGVVLWFLDCTNTSGFTM